MQDYLAFRKWIAPVVIRVLFWLGVLVVVLGGLRMAFIENFLGGLAIIIVGPILVRLIAEILLIPFVIRDMLLEVPAPAHAAEARSAKEGRKS